MSVGANVDQMFHLVDPLGERSVHPADAWWFQKMPIRRLRAVAQLGKQVVQWVSERPVASNPSSKCPCVEVSSVKTLTLNWSQWAWQRLAWQPSPFAALLCGNEWMRAFVRSFWVQWRCWKSIKHFSFRWCKFCFWSLVFFVTNTETEALQNQFECYLPASRPVLQFVQVILTCSISPDLRRVVRVCSGCPHVGGWLQMLTP